ncbi:GLPGLI family protein [Flavobacterium cyanobacteriorum]|uniref:GLPGLI family protein n=1 Tax=Flavobacterium cyanobacteriorum TaxID=2022802 RepID=A0A255ZAQ0_9FLAO|nr:GLPGLI family protein [Flavobacterium cyanobacteriorum]OYQ37935.1 GLPGLI family protein [Flavobacterium cyanobacteriorum]
MKNRIVFALILLANVFITNAQEFQGMAVYESKTSTADFKMEGREITPEVQKMIQERMRKALEKTFILRFDKSASTYEEEEKLDTPGADNTGMRIMASFTGAGGKHYKNIKDKSFAIEKEIFGKEFLINDTLPKINWKMENESKKIGNYTCYKATAVIPVNKSDFRNLRRKQATDKKEDKKDEAQRTTNFMDMVEMPKEVTITAWYSPEIPVSQGPENYWGLPGLILEVNDGKTIILCSKVVLNTKEKAEIKAPKKGTKVTQAEFDTIVAKKMEEMQEMFRTRGGNGTQIRVGG